jgi:hypothetical protein
MDIHWFGRSHGTYLNNTALVEPSSTLDIRTWDTYIMGQMDKWTNGQMDKWTKIMPRYTVHNAENKANRSIQCREN